MDLLEIEVDQLLFLFWWKVSDRDHDGEAVGGGLRHENLCQAVISARYLIQRITSGVIVKHGEWSSFDTRRGD